MYQRSLIPLKTVPYVGELPRWLNLAWKLSFDSTHPQFRMGCVIVKSGSILALAANHHAWGKHAEARCLSRVEDASGATIYVMRANRRVSKPCGMCMITLRRRKIRRAIFVNVLGQIEEMRL